MRANYWDDFYAVGGDGWWYCVCCHKRTSEALMTEDWFETKRWVLCPTCLVKAAKDYVRRTEAARVAADSANNPGAAVCRATSSTHPSETTTTTSQSCPGDPS